MSVSFRAVLSLWKPMGFMMSLRSVRMLYAIAPESSGSRWNTVRQFRMLWRTPPFSVVSSPALISSMLWGGCMAFMVFFSSCCVCGCKLCHSLFKLYHILSVVRNQSRFFLCLPEQQHIQQIFHLGLLL